LSIKSVIINQKPESIMIHVDFDETQMNGKYWDKLKQETQKIIVKRISRPDSIFGLELNHGWLNWHASDIARARILMEYGGIYLDRDVYLVKSLDKFRKFEMT